jgi:hypothetical protein
MYWYWCAYMSVDCGDHTEAWAQSVFLETADQRSLWCTSSDLLDVFDLYVN